MTLAEVREDLTAQARRLVDTGVVNAGSVSINPNSGTVRNSYSGQLLHYESGITVRWDPWKRPQVWVRT